MELQEFDGAGRLSGHGLHGRDLGLGAEGGVGFGGFLAEFLERASLHGESELPWSSFAKSCSSRRIANGTSLQSRVAIRAVQQVRPIVLGHVVLHRLVASVSRQPAEAHPFPSHAGNVVGRIDRLQLDAVKRLVPVLEKVNGAVLVEPKAARPVALALL